MITKKTSYIKILIKQTCALLIGVITCNVYVLFIHTLGEIKQPPVPVLRGVDPTLPGVRHNNNVTKSICGFCW